LPETDLQPVQRGYLPDQRIQAWRVEAALAHMPQRMRLRREL